MQAPENAAPLPVLSPVAQYQDALSALANAAFLLRRLAGRLCAGLPPLCPTWNADCRTADDFLRAWLRIAVNLPDPGEVLKALDAEQVAFRDAMTLWNQLSQEQRRWLHSPNAVSAQEIGPYSPELGCIRPAV